MAAARAWEAAVRKKSPLGQGLKWRGILCAGGWAALGLAAAGCANTWDTLSSRRFRDKPMETLFSKEDPMVALRNNGEGDDRIRAMHAIQEPKRNGGSDAQQDELVQILGRTATEDKAALCRLAAIDALSRFEDPRVPPILVTAYRNATIEEPQSAANAASESGIEQVGLRRRHIAAPPSTFAPEIVTAIQCRSLEALGATHSPAGLAMLCDIASKPAKPLAKETDANKGDLINPFGDGVDEEKVRVAAVRALGSFTGDQQAMLVLIGLLKNEKDVVVRSRAHEALMKITGQNLPATADVWEAWLRQGAPPMKQEPNLIQRVGAWFSQ
jgi:HEAT repeat protein